MKINISNNIVHIHPGMSASPRCVYFPSDSVLSSFIVLSIETKPPGYGTPGYETSRVSLHLSEKQLHQVYEQLKDIVTSIGESNAQEESDT